MKLIGISGKAGSGKDTIADYLFERHGFLKISFADPLKAAASKIFGVNLAIFYDRDKKESPLEYWNMTPRRMLQLLGNEAVKPHFGDDLWIKRWFLSYQQVKDTDCVVVPDCRFDRECVAIRYLGGTMIHLERPGAGLDGEAGTHSSEVGPTQMAQDFLLVNDGTVKDLYAAVEVVLKRGA